MKRNAAAAGLAALIGLCAAIGLYAFRRYQWHVYFQTAEERVQTYRRQMAERAQAGQDSDQAVVIRVAGALARAHQTNPSGAAAPAPARVAVPEPQVDPDKQEQLLTALEQASLRLNSPEQLSAAVPQPEARRMWEAIGTALSRFYNREQRNDAWAGAMEREIRAVFAGEALAKFPGLSVEVECRVSTCRVTLDAPLALVDEVSQAYFPHHRPLAVPDQVFKDIWPMAPSAQDFVESEQRFSVILAFDDRTITPQGYRAWRQEVRAEIEKRGPHPSRLGPFMGSRKEYKIF